MSKLFVCVLCLFVLTGCGSMRYDSTGFERPPEENR